MLVTSGDDDSSSESDSSLAPDDVMDKRPIPRWLGCGASFCFYVEPTLLPETPFIQSLLHKYLIQDMIGMIEPQ